MSIALIPIILMVISLGTILVIVGRRFSQLSLLDVDNLPEEKEAKKKNEYLKKRVEKIAVESKKVRGEKLRPTLQKLKELQLSFRKYVGTMERAVMREMKQMSRGIQHPKSDEQTERVRTVLHEAVFAYEQGDLESSEKKYIDAIRLDAKNKEAYLGLGDVYRKLGQLNEAKETFAFVLQFDPSDDRALVRLGELAEAEGKLDDAVQYYERSILTNDDRAPRFAKLAELLSALGQYTTALEAVQQALELEPENPKYIDMMVEISILVGDKALAEDSFQRLRMVNPDNQKLPLLKDRIEKIQD